jgi:hypothetical protein
MSHLEGESPEEVLPLELFVVWAPRATGIKATNAKARARLIDFKTCACMRLFSAIELNDQVEMAD